MLKLKKVLSLALAGAILFPAVAFADASVNEVNVESSNVESSEVASVEDKIEQANKRWLELEFALRCTNEDEASIKLKAELEEERSNYKVEDSQSVEVLKKCNDTLEGDIIRLFRKYGFRRDMLVIKNKMTCINLLTDILTKHAK